MASSDSLSSWRGVLRSTGRVLEAVGDPDVGHAGRAQLPAKVLADLAAGDAVLDPELADARVVAGQGKAVVGQGMREEGGVKVDAVVVLLGPVDPAGKMLGLELVALDLLAAGLGIDGVQVQPVRAGDQAVGLVQVAAQLVGVARLAGIVAGGGDAAAQLGVRRSRSRPRRRPASSAG